MTTTRALWERLYSDKNLRRICGWENTRQIPGEAKNSKGHAKHWIGYKLHMDTADVFFESKRLAETFFTAVRRAVLLIVLVRRRT